MKDQIHEKALVTGGGGFLGKAIAGALLKRGTGVFSFSRKDHPDLAAMGVTQIRGDLCDYPAVENAAKGVDVIYHTAAKAGVWGKFNDYWQPNVLGTRHVIAACRKHGVRRLIYTSSASVVYNGRNMTGGDESLPYPAAYMTHYPRTKAMAEQMVIQAADPGLLTIVIRPHLIWGPGDNHLIPRIIQRANRLVRIGDGKNVADTIYIDNAAEAHLLAADNLRKNPALSGRTYFISQGDPMPVWEMINRILQAAGLPPVRRSIPVGPAWVIAALMELIYKSFNIDGEPQLTRFLVRELSTSHWYDISAAKRDLGFFPGVTTQEGFDRLEQWLGARNRLKASE